MYQNNYAIYNGLVRQYLIRIALIKELTENHTSALNVRFAECLSQIILIKRIYRLSVTPH